MLWFLLIFLIIVAIFMYKITHDYFSPSFLLSIVFIISCFFSIIGNVNWKCDINFYAIIVIVIAILFICLGELFARFVVFKESFNVKKVHVKQVKTIHYNKIIIIAIIVLQIIFTIFYYRRMVEIAINTGYKGENYFMYARNSSESAGFIYNFAITSFEPFALICMFIFINNFISNMKSSTFIKNILLIIPTVLFSFTSVLTGARVGIVEYVIIFVLMILFFIRKINFTNFKIKYRYIFIPTVILIITFVFAFMKIGESRSGTATYDSFEYANIYTGSSIVAFSEWFPNRSVGSNDILGSFRGIYNTFSRINSNYESTFYSFVSFNNGTTTNVYTGFRTYIEDFGIVGLFIISFLIGLFISVLYKIIINSKSVFLDITYIYFLKQFLYLFLAPSITSNLLSPTQLLFLFWLLALCMIFKYFSYYEGTSIPIYEEAK